MGDSQNEHESGLSFGQANSEAGSRLPWVFAGAAILLGLGLLVALGGRRHSNATPVSGPGLAPPDAYSAHLTIDHVQMSEASNFAGGKVTYLDGRITNSGGRTLTGVVVQVAFRNDLKEIAQKEAMPMSLIRTREPYVDTQPMSATPLKPGESREFRLIFDSVPGDWNQQYPEVRVIQTAGGGS